MLTLAMMSHLNARVTAGRQLVPWALMASVHEEQITINYSANTCARPVDKIDRGKSPIIVSYSFP